jgi:hypothetical protein
LFPSWRLAKESIVESLLVVPDKTEIKIRLSCVRARFDRPFRRTTAAPSGLSLEKDGPIVGVGRGRRVPNRTVDGWKVDLFPRHCAEPKCAVAAGLELHGDLSTLRQIDGVALAWIGEAVVAVVRQLVVRVGLPSREAGEEIDHVTVAEEHGHLVVATAVEITPPMSAPTLASRRTVYPAVW